MQGVGVLEQQTLNFINENPYDIALVRHVGAADGAGGQTYTDTPLAPQTVRIVQVSQSAGTVERRTVDGQVVRPDANVIAMPDADIVRGDTFDWGGINMEVVWVANLGYELMAELAAR